MSTTSNSAVAVIGWLQFSFLNVLLYMATRVFLPICPMSGIATNESSAAGITFVMPVSNVTVAETFATASSSVVPRSTFLGTDESVIDTGCLSSAEVNPPIGSRLDWRKLMYEPSGTRNARIFVLAGSSLRFTSGVFCLYVFVTVPFVIFTVNALGSERSIVSTTVPPSFCTPSSVSVLNVSVLVTLLRSM